MLRKAETKFSVCSSFTSCLVLFCQHYGVTETGIKNLWFSCFSNTATTSIAWELAGWYQFRYMYQEMESSYWFCSWANSFSFSVVFVWMLSLALFCRPQQRSPCTLRSEWETEDQSCRPLPAILGKLSFQEVSVPFSIRELSFSSLHCSKFCACLVGW